MPYPKANHFLVKLKDKFESQGDWLFVKCPVSGACRDGGTCSETMGDFLCSECKEGFSNNFESEELCTVCPQVSLNGCLLFLYYLGLLLFNIVMAYLNVSAGFNRRSIHSIVIKIASNFVTCINYSTLDRLENHSMAIWTFACCTVGLILGGGFSGSVNLALLVLVVVPVVFFVLEVLLNLAFAYFDNVRATKPFFGVPFLGLLFQTLAALSEKRKSKEPLVLFNEREETIELLAARRRGALARLLRPRSSSSSSSSRSR
ncbi:hypothetical protein ETH_00035745 [Eimeria tenella]|uniref:DUF7630 domain-containing protein n=1 Tax=Eimeria tenella TaxID=5802 RepID=U6KQ60_EIMTE|nr:hypothetical protein ETH_00035745 [Eimeria tenella]CDJ38402.1 hypothetical protein ETH_00035745 [Eimeria tenella]|eukprot:XP_013229240.1 hypothetical protein ETH_00035745 [Eimeria tenella]